jgi:hypothetical protein
MSFDVAQAYIEMSHQQEQARIIRARANLAILRASTIPFIVNDVGQVKLRDRGYPAIDFAPSQNEWLVGNRKMLGDATALIEFLKRRAIGIKA